MFHRQGAVAPCMYDGQRAALATCHGKDAAIAAPFAMRAGLRIEVPPGLDTDRLGTFTGEVPRPGTMRETARLKAAMGMERLGLPLGIASEGSFGPHPDIPFLAAGFEVLLFVDRTRGIEVAEEQVSEATNYAALDLGPAADVEGFLARAGFPSHAVILRSGAETHKGIRDRGALFDLLRAAEPPLRLETDMRAHMNPTRMSEIAKLAERLAQRLATCCPACRSPGFGMVRALRGLPCEDCDTPTRLVRALVHGCAQCGHEEHQPRPDGLSTATPANCPECNP